MFGELGPKGKPVDNRIATSLGYQQTNVTYAGSIYPGANSFPVLVGQTTGCLAIGPAIIEGNLVSTVGNTSVISSIAIGDAIVNGSYTVAIGTGGNSPLGYQAGGNAVAIGYQVTGSANTVTIGYQTSGGGANTVVIGYQALGAANSVVLGSGTAASTSYSVAIGNATTGTFHGGAIGNTATGNGMYGSWAIGDTAKTEYYGQFVFACGNFATAGDTYVSQAPLRTYTTNATPLEIGVTYGSSTAPAQYIQLANLATYLCTLRVVAQVKGGGGDSAGWNITFMVQRGAAAANTAIVGTPTGTSAPAFATAGAISGAWAVAVTADTTNGRPAIKVTGQASTNISWAASIEMVKTGY